MTQTDSINYHHLSGKTLYLRLLSYVKPYWRIFLLSLIATAIGAATEPALPALLDQLIDRLFVEKNEQMIIIMPIVLMVLFFIRGISGYVSEVAIKWVSSRVVADLRKLMFNKILTLPVSFFDHHATGNIVSKLTFDVQQVMTATTRALITLVRDGLTTLGLLILVFYYNWELALIIFIVMPLIIFTVHFFSRKLRKLNRYQQEYMGDMTHVIEEAITAHKVVKVFQGQEYERQRFKHFNEYVRETLMKLTMAVETLTPLVMFLIATALSIIIYYAGTQSLAGELTAGEFVGFFTAMTLMFPPIKRLTKINDKLQKGIAAAESIFSFIDTENEHDKGTKRLSETKIPNIEFKNICFSYDDKNKVLDNFNLSVTAGETIALVGPSGSGKSTIANLLPRFYELNQGHIFFDNTDITTISLLQLRQAISYVSQDIVLFNDSVRANICYGDCSVSEERIIEAATQAQAIDFINAMPEGLDTLIGENGVRLSGGQRQRLAIARAFLKKASILIMDEASSALDTHLEQKIQQALKILGQNKTVFIIAHRLSTIEQADRIIVMDKGHIQEIGSHQQLLHTQGLYSRLYRSQNT